MVALHEREKAVTVRLWIAVAALAAALPAASQETAPQRVERGNLVMEGVPEIPRQVRERLHQYENTRAAYFVDFTGDGGMLIATRFAETTQIHKVDEPLGMRRQLTFYDEPVAEAVVRQGDRGVFVFGKDTGGDEFYQGWLFDLETGRTAHFTEDGTRTS